MAELNPAAGLTPFPANGGGGGPGDVGHAASPGTSSAAPGPRLQFVTTDQTVGGKPSSAEPVAQREAAAEKAQAANEPKHDYDLTALGVADDVRPLVDSFAGVLHDFNAPPEAVTVAAGWITEARALGGPPSEPRKHSYQVNVRAEDQAAVDFFGNRAQAAGWSQEQFAAAVNQYGAIERENGKNAVGWSRLAERYDLQDAAAGATTLRSEWGNDYRANVTLINRYLDNLPDAERTKIEGERNSDGTRALNDPARLRELAKLARGAGESGKMSRAEIENVMRSDRRRYDHDLGMQARYLDVIRSGDTGASPAKSLPTGGADVAAEIASIEKTMRTNRRAYDRDAPMQTRYRQLLAQRDGN